MDKHFECLQFLSGSLGAKQQSLQHAGLIPLFFYNENHPSCVFYTAVKYFCLTIELKRKRYLLTEVITMAKIYILPITRTQKSQVELNKKAETIKSV